MNPRTEASGPASSGAAPVQAPKPIRALFDQSVALNDEASAVSLEAEAASDPATAKSFGEKSDRIGHQALACESAIFKTPACTIDELIIKARRAYWWCMEGKFRTDEFDVAQAPDPSKVGALDDQLLIWSILQDIESLAAPAAVAAPAVPASMAPVAEDPIVGLWRELLAHRASAEDDNKWLAIETEILQMDALTAEGWAIQAELLAEQVDGRNDGGDERVAKRIAQHLRRMADAERLAGGAA